MPLIILQLRAVNHLRLGNGEVEDKRGKARGVNSVAAPIC